MKVFLCKTKNGVKNMTLDRIIKSKRKGNQVEIINVEKIIEKGYKNGNQR